MKKIHPGFWAFVGHCHRRITRLKPRLKETLGVAMIFANGPLGWIGAILCVIIAERWNMPRMHFAAAMVYGASWVMLLTGIFLAGPEISRRCRQIVSSSWRAIKRLRRGAGEAR